MTRLLGLPQGVPLHYVIESALDEMEAKRARSRAPKRRASSVGAVARTRS
jgi:hypothetical protein